jgi:hypothetical protein
MYRDSAVGIATGYSLDDRGVGDEVPVGSRIFSSPRRPDRLWGPPATCSCSFLARGFFYPEDEGDTFLRNVGLHKIYRAPHPRRRHSS